jgi:hypothetical protein
MIKGEGHRRNPYVDEHGKPRLLRSVVAYADIIGYKNMIDEAEKQRKSEEFLGSLRKALDKSIGDLRYGAEGINGEYNYMLRTFTDNIVIGCPVRGYPASDDAEAEFGYVLIFLGHFQLQMALRGFFLRGAISLGDLYIDNDIVYGSGLVEAHDGEQKLARDPRIILTKSIRKAVSKHLKYYGRVEDSPQYSHLYIDADGQWFLNYLYFLLDDSNDLNVVEFRLFQHKKVVEERLSKYKSQPELWSKYLWIANYHNYFCEVSKNVLKDMSRDLKISLSRFQMKPKLIGRQTKHAK